MKLAAFFRVVFGWLFKPQARKAIATLLPYAKEAILAQAKTELKNAEKKNKVYSVIRDTAKEVLGEDISEHIIDVVFGAAFGQLRNRNEV